MVMNLIQKDDINNDRRDNNGGTYSTKEHMR